VLALLLACALALAVALTVDRAAPIPLSELQLGALGGGLTFAIFGLQGLLSVKSEGRELRPGVRPPTLTNPLSVAIVVLSLCLFAVALLLGYGIVAGWGTTPLGFAAGAGCLLLAALLFLYKVAFLGDEVRFDNREDGVPW
jgi:hypothetical protein